jgi:hypothetical protein
MLFGNALVRTRFALDESAGDEVIASLAEVRTILVNAYERYGDLALLPIIKRADEALQTLARARETVG